MKRIIFIGTIGSGKTTLSQCILGQDMEYKKTQAVQVMGNTILDTPGEYLELGKMRGALMISSAEAQIIGLVQSATDQKNMYPPAYAGSFAKEVIGIVTKIDVATESQIEEAHKKLKLAGASKVFKISSFTNEGIDELIEYLSEK